MSELTEARLAGAEASNGLLNYMVGALQRGLPVGRRIRLAIIERLTGDELRIKALAAMLRRVEWFHPTNDQFPASDYAICPSCREWYVHGHDPDNCELAAMLKEAGE